MTIAQIQTAINTDVTSKVSPNSITPTNVGAHLAEQAAHSVTRAELLTAIGANTLVPGALYEINDRGDLGLYFYAVKDNELSKTGWRRMLCPARYSSAESLGGNEWKGVWNSTKDPDVDDLMIWGGKVWKNLTGAIGTATSFYELDAVNWVLVTKTGFANAEYVELVFCVEYDLTNDYIAFQWDNKGNKVGLGFAAFTAIDGGAHLNYCDETDWNFDANTDNYLMTDNVALIINNNSNTGHILGNNCPLGALQNNSNGGLIQSNTMTGLGNGIFNNSNVGDISNNIGNSIANNSNNGVISGNRCFAIETNAGTGTISSNICGNIITNTCGNIEENVCQLIDANANTGTINNNVCGAITNNQNNVVNITGNVCAGIGSNDNVGDIKYNNGGLINGNTNTSHIQYNSIHNAIENNLTPVAGIQYNNNNGSISNNTNSGAIEYNSCGGEIANNSNTGFITKNKNNGTITNCTGASNITANVNNGNITGNHGADVTDTTVNK